MNGEARVPRFRRGVRFRYDQVRGAWVLLAPEKLYMPDEVAVEILKLVDGKRPIGAIADDLASRFDAPRELIVQEMTVALEHLSVRGALEL